MKSVVLASLATLPSICTALGRLELGTNWEIKKWLGIYGVKAGDPGCVFSYSKDAETVFHNAVFLPVGAWAQHDNTDGSIHLVQCKMGDYTPILRYEV